MFDGEGGCASVNVGAEVSTAESHRSALAFFFGGVRLRGTSRVVPVGQAGRRTDRPFFADWSDVQRHAATAADPFDDDGHFVKGVIGGPVQLWRRVVGGASFWKFDRQLRAAGPGQPPPARGRARPARASARAPACLLSYSIGPAFQPSRLSPSVTARPPRRIRARLHAGPFQSHRNDLRRFRRSQWYSRLRSVTSGIWRASWPGRETGGGPGGLAL